MRNLEREAEEILSKENPLIDPWTDGDGRNFVGEKNGYRIAVDSIRNATYVTAWKDGKKIGSLNAREISGGKTKDWLRMDYIEIKDHSDRDKGVGTLMYLALLKYMRLDLKGLASYLTDRQNKKQIPVIYKKLGGWEDDSFAYLPRIK